MLCLLFTHLSDEVPAVCGDVSYRSSGLPPAAITAVGLEHQQQGQGKGDGAKKGGHAKVGKVRCT